MRKSSANTRLDKKNKIIYGFLVDHPPKKRRSWNKGLKTQQVPTTTVKHIMVTVYQPTAFAIKMRHCITTSLTHQHQPTTRMSVCSQRFGVTANMSTLTWHDYLFCPSCFEQSFWIKYGPTMLRTTFMSPCAAESTVRCFMCKWQVP